MKRLPILLLTLLLALTLSACYTVPPESGDSSPGPTAEPTVEPTPEATAEPTSEPTAEPTPESTAEPTASPESTAAPARGGQTLEELEESVEISLGEKLEDRPDVLTEDLKEIIYGAAHSWMQYYFTEMEGPNERPELLDFECVRLNLVDLSEEGDIVLFWMTMNFLPETEDDWLFWAAGNTRPCYDREDWYHSGRYTVLYVCGKNWEIVKGGTGGFSMEDLIKEKQAREG